MLRIGRCRTRTRYPSSPGAHAARRPGASRARPRMSGRSRSRGAVIPRATDPDPPEPQTRRAVRALQAVGTPARRCSWAPCRRPSGWPRDRGQLPSGVPPTLLGDARAGARLTQRRGRSEGVTPAQPSFPARQHLFERNRSVASPLPELGIAQNGAASDPGREIRLDRPCRVLLPQCLGHEGPAAIVPKADLVRGRGEVVGAEVRVRELAEALSADQTHDVILVDRPPRIEPLRPNHDPALYRHAALHRGNLARDCRSHGFHAAPLSQAPRQMRSCLIGAS